MNFIKLKYNFNMSNFNEEATPLISKNKIEDKLENTKSFNNNDLNHNISSNNAKYNTTNKEVNVNNIDITLNSDDSHFLSNLISKTVENESLKNNLMNENNNDNNNRTIPCPKSIHFGAVAYGCGFYVGVHRAFEELYGIDFHKQLESVHGDSAGVFFALGIVLGKTSEYMDNLYRTLSIKAHQNGIFINNTLIVNEALDLLIENNNIYNIINNKFSLGVTEFPLHHKRYNQWNSNEELRISLHGSMYLPLYCNPIEPIDGKYVIDGGFSFTGNDLSHGNETLFIGKLLSNKLIDFSFLNN